MTCSFVETRATPGELDRRISRPVGGRATADCCQREPMRVARHRPVDDPQLAGLGLDDRRAALDPVAAIEVVDAVDLAVGGMMDVAADDAVAAVAPRLAATASSKAPMKLTAFFTRILR